MYLTRVYFLFFFFGSLREMGQDVSCEYYVIILLPKTIFWVTFEETDSLTQCINVTPAGFHFF